MYHKVLEMENAICLRSDTLGCVDVIHGFLVIWTVMSQSIIIGYMYRSKTFFIPILYRM